MNTYLENITPDYNNAEITCLFLHDERQNKYFNLLTLIELVPDEQEASPLLGVEATKFLDRNRVNDDFTVYMARSIGLPVAEAISIFENVQQGYRLKYGGILNAPIDIYGETVLEREPAGQYPLLINKEDEQTLGPVLPQRNTNFRVWTMLDRRKGLLNDLEPKARKMIPKKMSVLTLRHLGFDLALLEEHWGNVYLFGCNPFLRGYSSSLLDADKNLLIHFHERLGKSISGCRVVLQDKRADNWGFHIDQLLADSKLRIELPNFPNRLFITIFDLNDYPLEQSSAMWINFKFDTLVQEAVLSITTKGGKTAKISKYADGGTAMTGSYDHSLATYLKEQLQKRRIVASRANKEFAFFPGSETDKQEARTYISEIINKSSTRCILLDTYFDEQALFYAYATSKLFIPIFILASAFYLRKTNVGSNSTMTYGELLLEKLEEFRLALPSQTVECRVLSGNSSSQLHDRYIVSDNEVYLLGSSFNEFGSRATTIFRVPAPEIMIAKADEWWNESTELSDFVSKIVNTTDEV